MKVCPSVRVGDLVFVVGMVGRDSTGALVPGVVAQTRRALERVEEVLSEHDLSLAALVRLRIYLADMGDWPVVRDEITSAIGETWPPAVALEVAGFVDAEIRVELEVDAAVG